MGFIPDVYEEHDANTWIERLAPVALVVGVALVILFQQFLRSEHGATLTTPLPEVQAYEVAREPTVSNLVVSSKLVLKECHLLHMAHEEGNARRAAKEFEALEKEAVSRVDRFRVAIVAADFQGAQAGVHRLEALEKEVAPDGELSAEVFWMLKRYRQVAKLEAYEQAKVEFDKSAKQARAKDKPAPEKPAILKAAAPAVESMAEEMRIALVARHGFFGRLALVQGPDRDEGTRNELLGGYVELAHFMGSLGALRFWMGIVGIVILGFFIKEHLASDKIGLEDPLAPTTVYLEMFAIMVLSFAVITAINVLFLGSNSPAAIVISEILIWMLPLCVFWPRLRGVAWRDAAADLGFNSGSGVFKEVMAGIGGACASIPLLGIVHIVIGIVQYANSESTGDAPSVRPPGMYDAPDGMTWGIVWMGTLSAVIWAPLLEETMFRGGFQRWLRVRMKWPLAILVSSAVFGFIHPYSLDGLISVAFGGLCFGIMREWRQCLIAPIVMHFMHNGFISLEELGFLIKLG